MGRVCLRVWFILLLVGVVVPVPCVTFGDVYVSSDRLLFQWVPAAGEVDRYEIFVNRDGRGFPVVPDATVSHVGGTPGFTVEARDRTCYAVKVRAVSDLFGPGPLSEASDRVSVFLDATDQDLDGDGLPDFWEEEYGLDPRDAADARADTDGDGLSNREEFEWSLNPVDPDTDVDGLDDGWEVLLGLDPLDATDNRPLARAGSDFLAPADGPVFLDGRESLDPAGGSLVYAWRQTGGPVVNLLEGDEPLARFQPEGAGTYSFELLVNNGDAVSGSDNVTVTVVESLLPGDLAPLGAPDGALRIGDFLLAWCFVTGILQPDAQQRFFLDVAPVVVLDEGEGISTVRIEPDGVLDSSDMEVLLSVGVMKWRVAGWVADTNLLPSLR